MKNIILSILFLFSGLTIIAQNRLLENYGFEIKMEVKNSFLLIQNQEKIDSFKLNESLALQNTADTNKVIRALRFDNNHLSDLYNQYLNEDERSRPNLIKALAERSVSVPAGRIIFVDAQASTEDVQDELVPIETIEATPPSKNPFGKWSWISMLIGALAGGVLVYFLGNQKNKPATKNQNTSSGNEDAQLLKAKEEIVSLKTTLKKRIEFDEKYFGQSFENIVKPLEHALEAKNTQAIVPLLIEAMAQYSALTRFKLEKKQSFDLANMQILLGNATFAKSDFPIISKNTSPDNIPNKLKALIELLQKSQAQEVSNTIISGYKIQDL